MSGITTTITNDATSLANAILNTSAGLTVSSATYTGGNGAAALVAGLSIQLDNVFTGFTIPSGIGLSSGTFENLPAENTSGGFGEDNGSPGDSQILAVAQAALGELVNSTHNAASLEFNFTLDNPQVMKSIGFSVVFGSEEYPEYADSYVDIATVIVDGVNYALFDGDASRPLSVTQANIDKGYFIDNSSNILPIEYDGVSYLLNIALPLDQTKTTHTIKIAIADTNDAILDSAMFVGGLHSIEGVVSSNIFTDFDQIDDSTLDNFFDSAGILTNQKESQQYIKKFGQSAFDFLQSQANNSNLIHQENSSKDKFYLFGGNDSGYFGGGNDFADGGDGNDNLNGEDGNDKLYGSANDDILYGGSGNDQLEGGAGNDSLYGDDGNDKLSGGEGDDQLTGGDGKDLLTGGDGADTFIFSSMSDFFNGKAADAIKDFDSAEGDKIDLSGIADELGELRFVEANAPFATSGEFKLVGKGSNFKILINSDTDVASEGIISITGIVTLDDLILS